jgi:cytidine deaminase
MDFRKLLITQAKRARLSAQARYSGFKVGAALRTNRGEIYTGCNIESSSYGLSLCAERVALGTALSVGETQFDFIAIVGSKDEYCPPCGACRQILHDYAPQLKVLLTNGKTIKAIPLNKLMPLAFDDSRLKIK